MKMIRQERHAVSGVFVFLLLGLFAITTVLMLLVTAGFYHSTVERSRVNNDARILTSYLTNMVQSGDTEGAVSVRTMDGTAVLVITRDDDCETRIWCDGTAVYEQLADIGETFSPDLGERICDAQALTPAITGNLLTVACTDAHGTGSTVSIRLYTTGGEVAP